MKNLAKILIVIGDTPTICKYGLARAKSGKNNYDTVIFAKSNQPKALSHIANRLEKLTIGDNKQGLKSHLQKMTIDGGTEMHFWFGESFIAGYVNGSGVISTDKVNAWLETFLPNKVNVFCKKYNDSFLPNKNESSINVFEGDIVFGKMDTPLNKEAFTSCFKGIPLVMYDIPEPTTTLVKFFTKSAKSYKEYFDALWAYLLSIVGDKVALYKTAKQVMEGIKTETNARDAASLRICFPTWLLPLQYQFRKVTRDNLFRDKDKLQTVSDIFFVNTEASHRKNISALVGDLEDYLRQELKLPPFSRVEVKISFYHEEFLFGKNFNFTELPLPWTKEALRSIRILGHWSAEEMKYYSFPQAISKLMSEPDEEVMIEHGDTVNTTSVVNVMYANDINLLNHVHHLYRNALKIYVTKTDEVYKESLNATNSLALMVAPYINWVYDTLPKEGLRVVIVPDSPENILVEVFNKAYGYLNLTFIQTSIYKDYLDTLASKGYEIHAIVNELQPMMQPPFGAMNLGQVQNGIVPPRFSGIIK